MDILIEKMRPKTLDDIVGQSSKIKTLKQYVNLKNIPNLLFYGKKGTGKTSTILALCKDLYGDEYKKYILELNASHERGINTIRTKVKTMAQTKTTQLKIIILDEVDSMTKEAMFALRMIMENYSHITRFCLICNYINKIIDPLLSRCTVFYFQPISKEIMNERLQKITNKSDNYDIIKYTNGDLRKALLLLQYSNNVDIDYICGISHEICEKLFNEILHEPLEIVLETCFEINKSAYNICEILEYLAKLFLNAPDIPNKNEILFLLSQKDMAIQNGMWEYIELVDFCTKTKIDFLKNIN